MQFEKMSNPTQLSFYSLSRTTVQELLNCTSMSNWNSGLLAARFTSNEEADR